MGTPGRFDDLRRYLSAIWTPGEVREIRIPKWNKFAATAAGWFEDPAKAAAALERWDGRANVYVTLNPVARSLLALANNRIIEKADSTTSDIDIVCRQWLFLDVDAQRKSGISSTDGELAAAREVLDAARQYLDGEGWPAPIVAMSGNGYYALYRVDLPNDDGARDLVQVVLATLAKKFNTKTAHVDVTVSNAARIAGVVGLLKVKGDETEERRHRRAALVSVPDALVPVSRWQLESLVAAAAKGKEEGEREEQAAPTRSHLGVVKVRTTLRGLLEATIIPFREQPPDASGITWFHLERCPFHEDGRDFECGVGQKLPDGPFAGHCFHPQGQGKGWQDFKEALGLGRRSAPRSATEEEAGLPDIMTTSRWLGEIVNDGWAAVGAANEPPQFFRHGPDPAVLDDDPERGLQISHLNLVTLRARLDQVARWWKLGPGDPPQWIPARPPKDVCETMLAICHQLPSLRGIVNVPVILADGSIHQDPGYQAFSKLYYEPVGEALPPIPDHPTAADVQRALDLLLDDWLVDFQFADEASKAHAVAAVVTGVARELIPGTTPLFPIDAPTPGSGKGFLAQTIGLIVTGSLPEATTQPKEDDEMRKRITSFLREGRQVVFFDNIKWPLDSADLNAVLTTGVWSDRLLATNLAPAYRNRSLWICTGNNLVLGPELARRSAWIRIDTKSDRPAERTGFKHDLFPWVTANRHLLVWAVLVLCRHWVASGSPRWHERAMGSFETWSETVGGILLCAGISGFLGNRERLYAVSDPDGEEWRAFIAAWSEELGDDAAGAGDLYTIVERRDLLQHLFARKRNDATERSMRTTLGNALRGARDRRVGRYFIRWLGTDPHSKGQRYRLELAEPQHEEGAGSAEVPQHNLSTSDSFAEPAVLAVPFRDPRARDFRECEEDEPPSPSLHEGGAHKVPQLPQVPQPDSETDQIPAEPPSPQTPEVPQVPQPLAARRCPHCNARPACAGRLCFRCSPAFGEFCDCLEKQIEADADGLLCQACGARGPRR